MKKISLFSLDNTDPSRLNMVIKSKLIIDMNTEQLDSFLKRKNIFLD